MTTTKKKHQEIWCLATDGTPVLPSKWNPELTPQGVLVELKEARFTVGLHTPVSLQFGAMDKARSPLVRDKSSFDSKAATDAMIAAYAGTHYEHSNPIWDVYGAPAAEWCRQFADGNIPAGQWDLPTLAQLIAIQQRRNAINECIIAMGRTQHRLTPGYHWSSIEESSGCAWGVNMSRGDVFSYYGKFSNDTVRAVSAFQF